MPSSAHKMEPLAVAGVERTNQDHGTPGGTLELLRSFEPGATLLDPCGNPWSPLGDTQVWLPMYDVPEHADVRADHPGEVLIGDGLELPWWDDARGPLQMAYFNPPYGPGRIEPFVWKATEEACRNPALHILSLVPQDGSTQWARVARRTADAILEWGTRIPFIGAGGAGAKQPSATFYWGPDRYRFCDHFARHGGTRVLRT